MIDTKALREKVLDLAIRGKLVPQDPNDEPASVLLERIRAEKQQMVKDGKLKAKDIKNDTIIYKGDDNLHYEKFPDGSVKCIEDEIHFELPQGWEWERLCNLASFSGGKTPSTSNRDYWEGDILWVTSKDMKCKYIDSSLLMISEKGLEQMQLYPENTMLLVTRSGILRHTIPVAILKKSATINQDLKAIMPYVPNLEEYIYICIKGMESRLIMEYTKAGATVENINFDAFQKILLPIPPENQIQCIIASINESDAVIDKLKCDQEDLIDIIKKIKSKILDLAIRGKLVPQDPNDEPASVLLERIRAEKEELIRQGKIKRDKKESVIFKGEDNSYYEKIGSDVRCIDDELPFVVPQNWCYARLSSITEIIMGASPNGASINNNASGIEFHQGKICFTDKIIGHSNTFTNNPVKVAKENSLLLCVRAPVGEVNITDRCLCIGRGLSAVSALDKMKIEFMFYWIHNFKKVLLQRATGSTFMAITADIVKNVIVPLPPLGEQNRICDAIDKMFNMLNTIEEILK